MQLKRPFVYLIVGIGLALGGYFLVQRNSVVLFNDQIQVVDEFRQEGNQLFLVLRSSGLQEKVDFLDLFDAPPTQDPNGRLHPPAIQSALVEYHLSESGRPVNKIKSAKIDVQLKSIIVTFDDGKIQTVPFTQAAARSNK
jgi:hypothetical protein